MSDDVAEQGTDQPAARGPACGNCGAALGAGSRVCPNCGATLPPTPDLVGTPATERYGPKEWLLLSAGVLVSVASPFVAGIGLLGAVVAFIILRIFRRMTTPFVRGLGIGLIIVGVCLMGLFAVCVWFFVAESQQHR